MSSCWLWDTGKRELAKSKQKLFSAACGIVFHNLNQFLREYWEYRTQSLNESIWTCRLPGHSRSFTSSFPNLNFQERRGAKMMFFCL